MPAYVLRTPARQPSPSAITADGLPSRSPQRSEGRRLVTRGGVAPPTSVCRTDVILFHHRALPARNSECRTRNMTGCAAARPLRAGFIPSSEFRAPRFEVAAGDGLAPPSSPSKGDVLLLDDPAARGTRIAHVQQPIADRTELGPWRSAIRDRRLAIGDSRLAIGYSPKALVEPEAVAASPGRIKSPVPVFCGFGS